MKANGKDDIPYMKWKIKNLPNNPNHLKQSNLSHLEAIWKKTRGNTNRYRGNLPVVDHIPRSPSRQNPHGAQRPFMAPGFMPLDLGWAHNWRVQDRCILLEYDYYVHVIYLHMAYVCIYIYIYIWAGTPTPPPHPARWFPPPPVAGEGGFLSSQAMVYVVFIVHIMHMYR